MNGEGLKYVEPPRTPGTPRKKRTEDKPFVGRQSLARYQVMNGEGLKYVEPPRMPGTPRRKRNAAKRILDNPFE
jgi:hypothetical protein